MKTAIVLSGGGARGAYQIGVWKALRKLRIRYDIVTGTSVGALNGLMMVQGDYKIAKKLWTNIDYKTIFNSDFKKVDKNIYLTYMKQFIADGGMDITNLETLLDKVYSEKRFYGSKIDFGLVVYNLSNKKEELLTKHSINPRNLKDFVIASASCYPAFKIKKIKGSKYIDGGYYDNLPINLAGSLGADQIIAVDLKAPGIKQKKKDNNIDLTTICPNNDIGSFLEFDKNQACKSISYGYNDTMKVFNRLIGNQYTFHKTFYHLITDKIIKNYESNMNIILKKYPTLKNSKKASFQKEFQDIIEYAGKIFDVDDSKIYYINYYNKLLIKKFNEIDEINKDNINNKILKKGVKGLLEPKYIVKYIYQNLVTNKDINELEFLKTIFKKEFLVAVYLITVKK